MTPELAARMLRRVVCTCGLAMVVGACSAVQVHPYASEQGSGANAEARIQYLVHCLECTATYSRAGDTESVQVEGSWSRPVSAAGRGRVTLTVTSGQRTTHLEGEIRIDGRLADRDRIESTSEGRRSLQLVATVPDG